MPRGPKARVAANIVALRTLTDLIQSGQFANYDQQQVLGHYTGWGGLAPVFNFGNPQWSAEREELLSLVGTKGVREFGEASLTSYYTPPKIAEAMWHVLQDAGLRSGSYVLEPGCGTGTFIGSRLHTIRYPGETKDYLYGVDVIGVEQDPAAAAIAQYLYPYEPIKHARFEDCHFKENSFTAAIGNVPFSSLTPIDPIDNPKRYSTHNYFILKTLDTVQDGGYVAVLTSSYTSDAVTSDARRDMIDRADLITAYRLPKETFQAYGTDVATDLLVFRKREEGREPTADSLLFEKTDVLEFPDSGREIRANGFFTAHHANILGKTTVTTDRFGKLVMEVSGDPDTVATKIRDIGGIAVRYAAEHGLGQTAPFQDGDVTNALESFLEQVGQEETQLFGSLRVNGTDKNDLPIIERLEVTNEWVPVSSALVPNKRKVETAQLIAVCDLALDLQNAYRTQASPAIVSKLQTNLSQAYDDYAMHYGAIMRYGAFPPKTPTKAEQRKILEELTNKWRAENFVSAVEPLPEHLQKQFKRQAAEKRVPEGKNQPHLKPFLSVPGGSAALAGLESFDEQTQTATKTDFFYRNPARVARDLSYTENIDRALRESIVTRQAVDVGFIAQLMDEEPQWVENQLVEKRLAFRDPDNPTTFIQARNYLSGQVYDKLRAAQRAARDDDRYATNVESLKAVLPKRIEDVDIALGATWIPHDVYVEFLSYAFEEPRHRIESLIKFQFLRESGWVVEVDTDRWRHGCPADMKYGVVAAGSANRSNFNFTSPDELEAGFSSQAIATRRSDGVVRTAPEMFEAVLNLSAPELRYSKAWKERHPASPSVHENATHFARLKAQQLADDFTAWVNSDPERRTRLVDRYNDLFNRNVAPVWDGSHRKLEGLSEKFTPYSYQLNAVERIVSEPTVLLNHVVGAGKSGTMFMAAMELKRAGLAKQPWIVMPNLIAEQMTHEFSEWYPTAKILSGYGLHSPTERAQFIMQSIAGDWDAVLCPQSVFSLIPMSKEARLQYLENEREQLWEELKQAQANGAELTEQQIKNMLDAFTVRIKKVADEESDPNLQFEATKCDYLFVDEAHNYKNLPRVSTISEVNHVGSMRAVDLDMKLDYLRNSKRDHDPIATFATGTPISNNIAECWVMTHYLRPDILDDSHVSSVQEWAANFTKTVETVELNASGTDLHTVMRVGAYKNAPELSLMNSMFMDMVFAEQIEAKLPQLDQETVTFDPGDQVRDFIHDLAERQEFNWGPEAIKIDPAIKYRSDGKKVTLHPPLANVRVDGFGPRVEALADRIISIWQDNKDNVYASKQTGKESPLKGALQLVFSDKGVNAPRFGGDSVYKALRKCLVARGMDYDRIRLIGEWDKNKAALHQDCREGHVDVIIGSTSKLGTGVNIQDRAIALHHLDVPERPTDLNQREGRLVRQGNQNDDVTVYRYIAAQTFDQADWQLIERKAAFIEQLYRNDAKTRGMDLQLPSEEENAAQLKAMAADNPAFTELVQVEADLKTMQAEYTSWKSSLESQRWRIAHQKQTVDTMTSAIEAGRRLAPEAERWSTTPAKERTFYTPDGRALTRSEANEHIYHTIRKQFSARDQGPFPIVQCGNVKISAAFSPLQVAVDLFVTPLGLHNGSTSGVHFNSDVIRDLLANHGGVVTRVENLVKQIPERVEQFQDTLERAQADLRSIDDTIGTTFPQQDAYDALRYKHSQLKTEVRLALTSDEAKRRDQERQQRMEQYGRDPMWTLLRNPTPALAEKLETTQEQLVWEQLHIENRSLHEHEVIDDAEFAKRERELGPSPNQLQAEAEAAAAAEAERIKNQEYERTQDQPPHPSSSFDDGQSLSRLVGLGDCQDKLADPQTPDSPPPHNPQEKGTNQKDQKHHKERYTVVSKAPQQLRNGRLLVEMTMGEDGEATIIDYTTPENTGKQDHNNQSRRKPENGRGLTL